MMAILMNYRIETLGSGLRLIQLASPSPVVYCGIAVEAGTRDERPGEEGLAHFCEHLSFKGTLRRSAMQIINSIEGIGGELNAFTNKEDTVFYAVVQKEHLARAVDVLCDIVFFSQYPQAEVEKEVEVVCDEIESFEDSPSELIFDEMENILFSDHPLGHNILGSQQQLRTYTSVDARRFTQRHYRPERCVFFVSGDVDFQRLCRLVEKHVPKKGDGSQATTPERAQLPLLPTEREYVSRRATHQAHVMMGTTTFGADDPRRWSLFLLNNLLGGPGLNSRLNLSLRERHGLVYSADSTMVSYSDTGFWGVYFGCDAADINRCRRLVRRELDRLIQSPLSARQLSAAKRQLKGQLAIASDQREQYVLDFVRNFLHHDAVRGVQQVMEHIDSLTPDELQETACQLFAPERITTLIYQ